MLGYARAQGHVTIYGGPHRSGTSLCPAWHKFSKTRNDDRPGIFTTYYPPLSLCNSQFHQVSRQVHLETRQYVSIITLCDSVSQVCISLSGATMRLDKAWGSNPLPRLRIGLVSSYSFSFDVLCVYIETTGRRMHVS